MRSSLDKHRDMARSILPSRSRRKAAWAKAAIKRQARRHSRQQLRTLQDHDVSTVDDWDASFDARAWPDAEINQVVSYRRQADKLNHFERWAVSITRALPVEDRLGHMAALLPGGLIGDHGISHLVRLGELNPNGVDWRLAVMENHARAAQQHANERERYEQAVRLMLEHGYHGELNAAIKNAVGRDRRARVVLNIHDVAPFVHEVTHVRRQGAQPELVALNALIDELAPSRFGVAGDWRSRAPPTASPAADG